MKKYFYSNGSIKDGPFTLEELKYGPKSKDINDSTLIWFEGLDDWTSVKEIEEFKLFLEMAAQAQINKKVPPLKAERSDREPSELEQNSSPVKIRVDASITPERDHYVKRGKFPSKAKYIAVWFAAGAVFCVAQALILAFLDAFIVTTDLIPMAVRWLLLQFSHQLAASIVSLVVFYIIYRQIHRDLDIKKVLPYTLFFATPIFVYIVKSSANQISLESMGDELFYVTSIIFFVLLNFLVPYLLMKPSSRRWLKKLLVGLLIIIGVGIFAASNFDYLANLYSQSSPEGVALNQPEETSASNLIPESVLILEKAARSVPASDWSGNVEAYERVLVELMKEKDSISKEQFKAKRYLYNGKIEQYKKLGKTKEDNEQIKLLEDYLSKLVVSVSKDLPRATEGVLIDSVKRSDTDIIFQVVLTGASSTQPLSSTLMEFACSHRELRVALINGGKVTLMLERQKVSGQKVFRVDESTCVKEFGPLENYGNYDMSVEPEEGIAHPKSAAWVFTAWWGGYPKIMKAESCPISKDNNLIENEFNYYWSLLQLKLPNPTAVPGTYVKTVRQDMYSLLGNKTSKLVDKAYAEMANKFKEYGHSKTLICDRLESATQNILNRQVETLKACVKGDCIYGGGGEAKNISYEDGMSNEYPEGHPLRAMKLFDMSDYWLWSIKKLPECRRKKYEPLDHVGFVEKYNAIYGLKSPSSLVSAKESIKENISIFPQLNQNGDNIVESGFSTMVDFSKAGGSKGSRLCDALYKQSTVVAERQFDMLDRCLNGECLNGVTP
jgi:hypothetical protein